MADLLLVENDILDALRNPDTTMESIKARFHLENSLLHEALITQNQTIISALEASARDFNVRDAMGQTIVHTIAELGDARCLAKLQEWSEQGRLNVHALTDTERNFLHYIPHITDPTLLATYFSLATLALMTATDHAGDSPLQLAIAQDNVNFLEQAVLHFPELIALEKYGVGCRMHLQYLLHDIAKAGAVQCFAFLRSRFDDSTWFGLLHYRNQTEELPTDTAVLAGRTAILQMFKGYRDAAGCSSLQWTAVQACAANPKIDASLLPLHLYDMVNDANNTRAFEEQKRREENEINIDPDDCIIENIEGKSMPESELELERGVRQLRLFT